MNRLFEASRSIPAPADVVWHVMSEVSAWPQWTPTVTAVHCLDEGPLAMGSGVEIHQPRLPKAKWRVTEFVEGAHFTWESAAPGIRTIGRHEVTKVGEGSEIRLSIEQTGPMGVVAALVWRSLTRRYVESEAACLEQRAHEVFAR